MIRKLAVAGLCFAAGPAGADPLSEMGHHHSPPPPGCVVIGEKLNGDPAIRNCTPPAGSPEAALRELQEKYPTAYRKMLADGVRRSEAEALKRRLHEEGVERWTPPPPKRERGI